MRRRGRAADLHLRRGEIEARRGACAAAQLDGDEDVIADMLAILITAARGRAGAQRQAPRHILRAAAHRRLTVRLSTERGCGLRKRWRLAPRGHLL